MHIYIYIYVYIYIWSLRWLHRLTITSSAPRVATLMFYRRYEKAKVASLRHKPAAQYITFYFFLFYILVGQKQSVGLWYGYEVFPDLSNLWMQSLYRAQPLRVLLLHVMTAWHRKHGWQLHVQPAHLRRCTWKQGPSARGSLPSWKKPKRDSKFKITSLSHPRNDVRG